MKMSFNGICEYFNAFEVFNWLLLHEYMLYVLKWPLFMNSRIMTKDAKDNGYLTIHKI